MARGGGGDLAGDAAEALLDELLEAPARAVAGEHGEIVQVEVGVLVGVGDLVVVYLGEPVVGGDGAGVREDEAADGVVHRAVLLDAPVGGVEVGVHDVLVVEVGGAHVAQLLALTAVEYVGLGDMLIAPAGEHGLDAVLDVLDGDGAVFDLALEIGRDLEREEVYDALVVLRAGGVESLGDGAAYLGDIEINKLALSFPDPVHLLSSCIFHLK